MDGSPQLRHDVGLSPTPVYWRANADAVAQDAALIVFVVRWTQYCHWSQGSQCNPNLQRPGPHRVRGVDHVRAVQAVVGAEVDGHVPAFL
jgi:hypothetical protein